ncbi:MAG TPA: glutamate cyclase domain-containing protein [Gemmataceae bacterium]|nr:glutamate cyclase domain-containing protein [Gemmataceae bacterium]
MKLEMLRDLIQNDIGKRGLRTDPKRNLIDAYPNDFAAACRSLAGHAAPVLAVVTGFYIPTATPPAGETDGPLGAVHLARALTPLGIRVVLITDDFCERALNAGLGECGLRKQVPVVVLPTPVQAKTMSAAQYRQFVTERVPPLTHLLAIERVGPSHGCDAIPVEHRDRCHTMRGLDITDLMSPSHLLFESAPGDLITIGIGDGGNEIGMGKIPRDVIERNIARGGLIACRIPTDHLIVCGVSNWGAYALAAGVHGLRGKPLDPVLCDPALELQILEVMVEEGELVDGVLGKPSATVDGLTWQDYAGVLERIGQLV